MKTRFALICLAALLTTIAACGTANSNKQTERSNPSSSASPSLAKPVVITAVAK